MTDVIIALVLTILIEIVVLLLLKANSKVIYLSILANLITNLTLNIVLDQMNNQMIIIIFIVLMEAIAIPLVEALIYFIVERKFLKSLYYSALANVTSFMFSFVLLFLKYIFLGR